MHRECETQGRLCRKTVTEKRSFKKKSTFLVKRSSSFAGAAKKEREG